jgi:hypothetical protein
MRASFGYELRQAGSISGPRVYSTDFHPSRFDHDQLPEETEATILRSLKVKFLTKGTVTINGAHLLNPAKGLMTRDPATADQHARRERQQKEEEALEALAPSNKATILTALRQLRLIASHEIAPN